MENIRETVEPALKAKGITAKQMCADLGITEQGFYRGLRENSMRMATYNRIKEYLEIDSSTKPSVSSTNDSSDYWKGLIRQLSEEITQLKIENWTLRKELGKFDTVHLSLSDVA
jgi:hypothetical protein